MNKVKVGVFTSRSTAREGHIGTGLQHSYLCVCVYGGGGGSHTEVTACDKMPNLLTTRPPITSRGEV